MTSLDTASALYEDVVDGTEQSSAALAADLEKKAREVREATSEEVTSDISDDVRDELNDALENIAPEDAEGEVKDVAAHLDEAAKDVRSSIGNAVTMKELDAGVAGQAQLGTDKVWIDSQSIRATSGDSLIDTTVASDIADHEEEHTRQSADANQEGVTINGKEFDAREVREAAAISVQRETDFLSAEYKQITAALPMNEADRALVREGDFTELERKKNGSVSPALAA
jgi:osmotically-inducible protein OsmY